MDLAALRPLLDRIAGVRVACVGDLMLDRYVHGEVSRISPEAPVPVFRRRTEQVMLGAVGNVARNVAALGGRATLHGRLGADAAGEQATALIRAEAGVEAFVDTLRDLRTTVKTRLVAAGQQLLRVDEEEDARPDVDFGWTDNTEQSLWGAACVLVSDYAKGAVDAGLIRALHETGLTAPVIVDPKGRDFARYGAVAVLKPNASELALATGLPTGADDEVREALSRALELCAADAIVVTRAAQGMSAVVRATGEGLHVPARAREVFDVSGAGDTSLAALGLALAAGADLETAMAFAIAAAGIAVEKAGTAVVTPEELLAERADPSHPEQAGRKYADASGAAARAAAWRGQGLKVGFTNGCFDVLHAGHVTYLAQARSWCDRLIVGLNDDASVRRLKGPTRPVNSVDSRATVLAGLASVDLVVPFAEDTPLELIRQIRPDLLVKGGDYRPDEIVGGDLVRGYGGAVRIAPTVPGESSSGVIARIQGQAEGGG